MIWKTKIEAHQNNLIAFYIYTDCVLIGSEVRALIVALTYENLCLSIIMHRRNIKSW